MFNYEDFEFIKTIENLNEIVDGDDWTHFHYICRGNFSNLEVIKYCIEHDADLNHKSIYGSTPFHFICYKNITKEVLEYCLENSADLNIENKFNNTPFYNIYYNNKHLIIVCKPYMDEYDFIKTLKEFNLNWKEYV